MLCQGALYVVHVERGGLGPLPRVRAVSLEGGTGAISHCLFLFYHEIALRRAHPLQVLRLIRCWVVRLVGRRGLVRRGRRHDRAPEHVCRLAHGCLFSLDLALVGGCVQ